LKNAECFYCKFSNYWRLFLADIITLKITGKGLSEHIDEEFNEIFDRPTDEPLWDFK